MHPDYQHRSSSAPSSGLVTSRVLALTSCMSLLRMALTLVLMLSWPSAGSWGSKGRLRPSRSSVQTPCPLVREWSGLASPGLGVQRRPLPQWAVWTPQDAPFSRAQAMQQPQPDSRRTCGQSGGTAGHPASVSCVQAAQRMGSGSSTGDDLTEARTARAAAAATSVIFSCLKTTTRVYARLRKRNAVAQHGVHHEEEDWAHAGRPCEEHRDDNKEAHGLYSGPARANVRVQRPDGSTGRRSVHLEERRYSTSSWCVVASSMLTIRSTSHRGNGSSLKTRRRASVN
ncbi:hypothetical protein EYF80_052145 [Liparis tanakae]|uniref:Uncharacterized protein n=1 Tax=Liparis tanakae TaxID=230148 RepID=A0A4Z2F9Q3_9TELE|nr:hypothetical protein EYF80_052145 [Liparis tanakae]